MPRKLIDIRADGSVVLSDPNKTGRWRYEDSMLVQAGGSIPQVECPEPDTLEHNVMPMAASAVEAAYSAATAEALGAYFDAVLEEGFEWGLAQKMLRKALKGLEDKTTKPLRAIQDLFR